MRNVLRRRPSAPMIIAIVALIVALAGTAIAAGPFLPKRKFVNFKGQVLKGLTYVSTTTTIPGTAGSNINVPVSASCPSGLKVIGGGIKVPEPAPAPNNDDIYLADSYPTTTGWAGRVDNYAGASFPATATTTAICAKTKSSTGSPPGS